MKKQITRRHFIQQSGKAGAALALSSTILPAVISCTTAKAFSATPSMPFTQEPLPYTYASLEPYIDAQTMEIHFTKHAATYAKNLAEATAAEGVNTANTTLEEVLGNISRYTTKMRNNAGGHYNHELFWKCMAPKSDAKASTALSDAIVRDFGSMDAFTGKFADAAKARFGSGWAWLAVSDKKLVIGSTPNQDNPLMNSSDFKGYPLLGLDVWEHAYYLKYQNKRADYINNWWNIVNWKYVNERFDTAMKL